MNANGIRITLVSFYLLLTWFFFINFFAASSVEFTAVITGCCYSSGLPSITPFHIKASYFWVKRISQILSTVFVTTFRDLYLSHIHYAYHFSIYFYFCIFTLKVYYCDQYCL